MKHRKYIPIRYFLLLLLPAVALGGFLFVLNGQKAPNDCAQRRQAFEVALRWNACLLDLNRFSEGYRPPVSARMFAYAGIAAWESALPALPEAVSSAAFFQELELPAWRGTEELVPAAALDAAYSTIARCFFPHTTLPMKENCARLSARVESELLSAYSPAAVAASRQFGEAVAEAVYQWSATDPIGHQAFLFNFDREYVMAEGLGQWRPPGDDFMPPLLPRWGKARTLVAHREGLGVSPPVDFSETPHSPFFAQAFEVYSLSLPLKDENRWIAEFWSDDIPGVTFSTASRWISIANQALEKKHPGLAVALETWLKLGLALNDAAVHIWDAKYQINLERPDTYIRRNINPDWNPLHHSPSFPGYPSGHAGFAGAAAAVLTHMLGDNFSLTDRSHQGRKEFMSKPRSYRSFDEMAEENALSRLLMGVHFRMDCEAGLKLGYAIGGKAAQLPLRCKTAALPPNEQT